VHLADHPEPLVDHMAALELDGLIALVKLDAAEARQEVVVPVGAPVLAVGHRGEADGALAVDRRLDAAILDGAKRGAIDAALGVRGPRLTQLRRAQQAADMIGAEGWLAVRHRSGPFPLARRVRPAGRGSARPVDAEQHHPGQGPSFGGFRQGGEGCERSLAIGARP